MNGAGGLRKVPTGIPGFDYVSMGGLPEGRVTLIQGESGVGKTIFACQFLAEAARNGQGAVFVSVEETPRDIRDNMAGLGMDIAAWEARGLWAFVDASPDVDATVDERSGYDLSALLARIDHAVRGVGAGRVVVDSLGGLFSRFADKEVTRRDLARLCLGLKRDGRTSLLLAGRRALETDGLDIENYMADAVVLLRNELWEQGRRRTAEVLKLRGADHQKGAFPYTIRPGSGIHCIPLSALEMAGTATDRRLSTGSAELDAMCGGGVYRDALVLVSGPTGTGKSLLGLSFLAAGAEAGERGLLLDMEESRSQVLRNARNWGMDLEGVKARGLLEIHCDYPESMVIEDHLIRMKAVIDEYRPDRVVLDSFSALARIASPRAFQEFALALSVFMKQRGIPLLFTIATSDLSGEGSASEFNVSTLTDTIILLRYVFQEARTHRGIQVLKMRGSDHDKDLRLFTIDDRGLHVEAGPDGRSDGDD